MNCETCGRPLQERAAICENCGEPVMPLEASPSSPSMFLTGGRTATRLISDLVPGEVLKAMLRPMPPRPHARVTIATWVDRKTWATAAAEIPEPLGAAESPPVGGTDSPQESAAPIIASNLLVDDAAVVRPARISDLAPDESTPSVVRKWHREEPGSPKLISLTF